MKDGLVSEETLIARANAALREECLELCINESPNEARYRVIAHHGGLEAESDDLLALIGDMKLLREEEYFLS